MKFVEKYLEEDSAEKTSNSSVESNCIPLGHIPLDNTGVVTTALAYGEEEEDFFEMKTEKEVRQLLSEVFMYLSNMGDYPSSLTCICREEIIGDIPNIEDQNDQVEKIVAQVLRWVLGEL